MQLESSPELLRGRLRQTVLARLGLETVSHAGMRDLVAAYSAWCSNVPFDNVRKMVVLSEGDSGPLPGCDAAEFFEQWLEHSTGATCWPASNALYVLLRTLGFAARRVAGSMRDLGQITHASVIVTLDEREWLLDASLQTFQPVPIGNQVYISEDPVYPAESEPVEDGHLLWWLVPPGVEHIPCRIFPQERPYEFYLSGHEQSRSFGPFNHKLYARRSKPTEVVVLFGTARYCRTAEGVEGCELDPEQLCQALHSDIGISEAMVERWRRRGALESTYRPTEAPKPFDHPSQKLPPSLRPAAASAAESKV